MKSKLFPFMAAVMLLIVAISCKNKDIDIETFKIENEAPFPSANSVTFKGSYSFSGNVEKILVNIGEGEDLSDARSFEMQIEGTDFSDTVEGLKPNTHYFYNYTIDFGTGTPITFPAERAEDFYTTTVLTVRALEVIALNDDSTSICVKCALLSDGGLQVTERGICWSTTHDEPTLNDDTIPSNREDSIYFVQMEHLDLGKTYHIRAYAINEAGPSLSQEHPTLSFKTPTPTEELFNIEWNCIPEDGGSVTGSGSFHYGDTATLKAEPNNCYEFTRWSDGNIENPRMVTVTDADTYTANFTLLQDTITVIYGTGGTAYVNSQGTTSQNVDCGSSCMIYALSDELHEFDNWTEDGTVVSSDSTYTVNNVTESHTFKANFKSKTYQVHVSVNPSEGGTATVSENGTFIYNQNCRVIALPAPHYHFVKWTENNSVVSTNADYTFNVTTNRELVANFEPDTLMIKVYAKPSNGGTVSIISEGINYGNSQSFAYGTTIQLSATANPGYHFERWSDNGAPNHSVQVMDTIYVAYFEENEQTTDQSFSVGDVSFTMKYVEGGTYWMGAQSTNFGGQNYDSDAEDSESPVHSVTISTFFMGETEVTQELWQAVMGSNPSNFSGTNRPVEQVSWDDCQDFIYRLNQRTNRNFRLPTEAEWEYAARGGNQSHGYKYAGSNMIGNVAWYTGNSNSQTHPVGTKSPNELGLYDMSGNVYEWCNDYFGNYSSGSQTNPQGPNSGSSRSLRGGSWNLYQGSCRVPFRGHSSPTSKNPSIGFRLVLPQ